VTRCIAQREPLAVPELVDVEVGQALRRFVLRGALDRRAARAAVEDLSQLPLDRYPLRGLVARAFDWHDNVTVYDGVYLALAEALERPLLTGDTALAAVPGCDAEVIVVSTRA
jgi:predicted nucleic acid-binding protein